MTRKTLGAIALLTMAACGGGKPSGQPADSLAVGMGGGDTALTPAPAPAPSGTPAPAPAATQPAAPKPAATPAPRKPVAMSLDTGTVVNSTAADSLSSRHAKVGDNFRATVSQDVKDSKGRVAIPAGSVVTFKVAAIAPAENKGDDDGKLRLEARDVSIDGVRYPINGAARTVDVEHVLEGRGVTAGDVGKVAAPTAGGAVVGGVVGGKTGAIVGGVAGAAAGTAVAVHSADRDVVVRPGMRVTFRLLMPFTVTR